MNRSEKNVLIKILLIVMVVLSAIFLSGIIDQKDNNSNIKQEDSVVEKLDIYFASEEKLNDHYQKHVIDQKEFGDITIEEYLIGAQSLPLNYDYSTIISNGDTLYYKSDTNEFLVVSKDNVIRTYFKPTDGIEYYNRQIGK